MCSLEELKNSIKIFDDIPIGIIITNFDGEIIHVNQSFCNITKYYKEDLIGVKPGKKSKLLYSGFHEDEFYNEMWKTIVSGNIFEGQVRNKDKENHLYWQKVIIKPHKNKEGIIENFAGYITDITDVVDNKNFLSRIINTNPGLIYVYDLKEKKYVYITKQINDSLGYSSKEQNKINFFDLLHPDDVSTFFEVNEKLSKFKNGEILVFTFRLKNKFGEYIWFRARESVFLRNENKEVIQKIGVAIDITNEKKLESLSSLIDKLFLNQLNVNVQLQNIKKVQDSFKN